ncbi:MAG TPA: hypothetical protein VGF74_05935 [Thermoleophilaceae bacterium]
MAKPRDTSEVRNRFFSRMWVRMKDPAEGVEHRKRNLAGLSGRVIELGAGDGRNFAFYPPGVTEVFAVEPASMPAWPRSCSAPCPTRPARWPGSVA